MTRTCKGDNFMDRIQYIDKSAYIVLYRMFTDSSVADVPGEIDGRPVTELADHAFSEESSVMYPAWQVKTAVRKEGSFVPEDTPSGNTTPLCGRALREVILPDSLTAIGNYAFYGCDDLTAVTFPAKMSRIGSGLFNICPSLRRLYFKTSENTPPVLQEVLRTISHEAEAVILNEDGTEKYRLVFPEFYEEPRENTPARIIQIIWHGTGYQYRQCFLERKIEFEKYDQILPLAEAQEAPETTVRLCLDRLKYPVHLTEKHRDSYVACLQRMGAPLWDFIKNDKDTDLVEWLKVLETAGYYTSSSVDVMIDAAAAVHRADAAAFLMDLKHRRFPQERTGKYEF